MLSECVLFRVTLHHKFKKQQQQSKTGVYWQNFITQNRIEFRNLFIFYFLVCQHTYKTTETLSVSLIYSQLEAQIRNFHVATHAKFFKILSAHYNTQLLHFTLYYMYMWWTMYVIIMCMLRTRVIVVRCVGKVLVVYAVQIYYIVHFDYRFRWIIPTNVDWALCVCYSTQSVNRPAHT